MWIETTIVPINKLCNRLIVSKARPRIVVSTVLESNNHLIVRRAIINQCLHHARWYKLILETRDEHDGKVGFQFLDTINVSPLVSTQELKVFEIGQCNVNHVGNTGERIFDNESLDLVLMQCCQSQSNGTTQRSTKNIHLIMINVLSFIDKVECSFGITNETLLRWVTLTLTVASIAHQQNVTLDLLV